MSARTSSSQPTSPRNIRRGAASAPHLSQHALVEVLAVSAGWIDTGLDLRAGEEVSLFSAGMVWIAEELGIGVDGGVALWHRIGTDGTISSVINGDINQLGKLQAVDFANDSEQRFHF